MKSKIVGAVILMMVVLAGSGYYYYQKRTASVTLNGFLGGEKIGLFEDEEVSDLIREEYHIEFSYARAGSLDMVTESHEGKNYLFPSSQTALEYYQDLCGKPAADEIIFNTPIVLYSHQMVVDALKKEGIISEEDGVYYADMNKLVSCICEDKTWSDVGLSELYGSMIVDTTDPTKSNSGNMFAALIANVLNGGTTVDEQSVDQILPQLKTIFSKLGYMETSSSDLFNQFLRMGVGAKPLIAGYENQLLEYAAENPDDYAKLQDDIVMIYPSPTVWSTHIYIALDEEGKRGIDALSDERVLQLAWEKHGFRAGNYNISSGNAGTVTGVLDQVTTVVNMPDYGTMKKMMEYLK